MPDINLLEIDEKKYFTHMSYQVKNIDDIFTNYDTLYERWREFTYLYPSMDNVVELFNTYDGIKNNDCQSRILKLYRNYSKEWEYFEVSL
ncbi:MAG: hypothetical protein R3E32_11520 [Chitinophagales bacterium]